MSELKPCPFCGSEDYYIAVTDNPFSYDTYSTTHCSKCHATGPFVAESYLEDEPKPTRDYMEAVAKEKWQTRPIEDDLRKRIAELTECVGSKMADVYTLKARIAELEAESAALEEAAEIEELGAQEAERKEFCPNCEAETPCTHEAELFVCDICGEDFAKYIVSRNFNVSDVSTTQDVLTSIKTSNSIENNNPDYYKDDVGKWIPIASGRLPEKFQECIVLDKNNRVHNWIHDDVLLPIFAQYTHWMPLPEPPEVEK